MNKQIEKAVEVLNKGGIVIFPTDTAFGIGCRIDNEEAVKRLFSIRKRPAFMATPVLVNGLEMAQKYLKKIPEEVISNLIKPYWPGALTIILQSRIDTVPELVRGHGTTIGVRMPNSQVIQDIIKNVGVPILGPSANFHGEKTPFEYKDLDPKLIKLVDLVLKGECLLKKPSTVVDCSKTSWKVLRIGAIDIKI